MDDACVFIRMRPRPLCSAFHFGRHISSKQVASLMQASLMFGAADS